VNGTEEGEIVSMGVWSDGNPYGIAEGLIYSFPVTCKGGKWTIVKGIARSEADTKLMKATEQELLDEKREATGNDKK
jgi:malate/lactate dehydrogenase